MTVLLWKLDEVSRGFWKCTIWRMQTDHPVSWHANSMAIGTMGGGTYDYVENRKSAPQCNMKCN